MRTTWPSVTAGVVRVPDGDDGDKDDGGDRPDGDPQHGIDRGRSGQRGEEGQGGPGHQQRGHGQHEEEALDDEGQQ